MKKLGHPVKITRPTASRCELMIRLVKANYGLSCESFHSSLLIERSQGLKTSAISAKLSWILMTIASRVLYICVTFWLLAHTPPVYLHLIFEISSDTWFFFNFEMSSLKIKKSIWFRNWFLQATQAVKIKFELEKKSSLIRNQFFFKFVINSQIDISKIKHR